MTDTNPSPTPIDTGGESSQPPATIDAPGAPPPPSADTAGTNAPPAGDPPVVPPGDVVPPVAVQESQPVPAGLDPSTLPLVDTPEAARETLGEDSGVSEAVIPAAGEPSGPEHPYDTIQRLRAKLAAYGEECLRSVQPEIEYLMDLSNPQHDHA